MRRGHCSAAASRTVPCPTPSCWPSRSATQVSAFAELRDRAESRADGFSQLGVGPGHRVAIAVSAGLAFVEVFWALQLLGAMPCAFNPYAPTPALTRRIQRLRPYPGLAEHACPHLDSSPRARGDWTVHGTVSRYGAEGVGLSSEIVVHSP
jgi:non-ribosomal peptide synthetase component E (peptide arylation enzyme)